LQGLLHAPYKFINVRTRLILAKIKQMQYKWC